MFFNTLLSCPHRINPRILQNVLFLPWSAVVICYYGSWATYRPFPAKYDVSTIDTSLCTHVVYTFAGLDTSTGKITSLDSWNDIDLGNYKKFTALEGVVPLLGVGGWNEGSLKYSQVRF